MLDSDKITERVLSGVRKDVFKSRIYVDSPEEVPDQYTPQTSDSGAVYYETDGSGGGGGTIDEPEDVVDEAQDVLDEIESEFPENEEAAYNMDEAVQTLYSAFTSFEEDGDVLDVIDEVNEAGSHIDFAIEVFSDEDSEGADEVLDRLESLDDVVDEARDSLEEMR
jgi:hypothetical protein